MDAIAVIATAKLRILRHAIAGLRKHSRLKTAVVAGFGVGYWCGTYFLFRGGFGFVEKFLPGLGEILINRLFYLFFLATFIMLVFSNMVLVYSLSYKSKEVDFLTAMPVRHSAILKWKFAEGLFFSSWASLFLAGPLILAYGIDRSAPLSYYVSVPAFLLPFLLIAAGVGTSLIIIVVRFFPGRKALGVFLLVSLAVAAFVLLRKPEPDPEGDILNFPLPVLDRMVRFARASRNALLPSTWLVKGMLLEAKGYVEAAPWRAERLLALGMLWSNGLLSVFSWPRRCSTPAFAGARARGEGGISFAGASSSGD
jgi:hypothetical protein